MPRDPDRQVHTPDEFVASYTALSGAETSRLRRIVVCLGRRFGLDGEDLKQSAVEAVLDDRRPWPRDVALIAFLTGVMRSFATAEIQRRARSPVLHPVSLSDPDAGAAEPEHGLLSRASDYFRLRLSRLRTRIISISSSVRSLPKCASRWSLAHSAITFERRSAPSFASAMI